MSKLQIRTYPDPILKKKGRQIEKKELESAKFKKLILNMFETMTENNGLGLAAPQIGQSLQLCTIKYGDEEFVLINPKIISHSWRKEVCEEGCLSFPEKFIQVKRPRKVTVKALDRAGKIFKLTAEGLLSKALQHEIDHLNGILFIEHEVRPRTKK